MINILNKFSHNKTRLPTPTIFCSLSEKQCPLVPYQVLEAAFLLHYEHLLDHEIASNFWSWIRYVDAEFNLV